MGRVQTPRAGRTADAVEPVAATTDDPQPYRWPAAAGFRSTPPHLAGDRDEADRRRTRLHAGEHRAGSHGAQAVARATGTSRRLLEAGARLLGAEAGWGTGL